MNILVYGYGNPGRQDDGLGNAMTERIDQWIADEGIANVRTDSNYQLNIEDAAEIADCDVVFFVDASTEDIEDFCITSVGAAFKIEFTMHAVSPAFVVDLCHKIYYKTPVAYLIHIRGYEWDFAEGLTTRAQTNLDGAFAFLIKILKEPDMINTIEKLYLANIN